MHRGCAQTHRDGQQLQVRPIGLLLSASCIVKNSCIKCDFCIWFSSGRLDRPRLTLIHPAVTPCFRLFSAGGAKCTANSLSSTWREMSAGLIHRAPTDRHASRAPRSTKVSWHWRFVLQIVTRAPEILDFTMFWHDTCKPRKDINKSKEEREREICFLQPRTVQSNKYTNI